MNSHGSNRRDFLKLAGLTALGAAGACTAPGLAATNTPLVPPATPTSLPATQPPATAEVPATQSPQVSLKKRVLRIAHMTDFHVQPEGFAPEGMTRALRHVHAQPEPPDFILNTGDSVMESLEADKGRAEAQWDMFVSILKAECKLPIIHAIGNHDVWGWGTSNPKTQSDPLYGKELAVARLRLRNRYYSFDYSGWHFVVLDSTHVRNKVSSYAYVGQLDDEQYQWLTDDLAATTDKPICIVSHIPIMAACEYFDGDNEASGNWVIPASWVHIDARKFRGLFLQSANVRLCLSGHTHQHEVLDYLGVRYMTNGAICGNWWNGSYLDFPPAYVMVNIYDDGSTDSTFVPYLD